MRKTCAAKRRCFGGMEALLDGIEARGLNWGIVTNKAERLARPLVAQLGLAGALRVRHWRRYDRAAEAASGASACCERRNRGRAAGLLLRRR